MEKENKIFRKSALDRISSPEQLNEYMRVTGPGVWWILAGLATVFAAFILWGVLGSIPEAADIKGTLAAPEGGVQAVYCYLTIEESNSLSVGMEARISPDYASKEVYGYIYGTVSSVGEKPVTIDAIRSIMGESFEYLSIPAGTVIEVVITPEMSGGAYVWSTAKGETVDVTMGSSCNVTVITQERKPYELMFR